MGDELCDSVVDGCVEGMEVLGGEVWGKSTLAAGRDSARERAAGQSRMGVKNKPRWQTITSSRSCAAARLRTSSEVLEHRS